MTLSSALRLMGDDGVSVLTVGLGVETESELVASATSTITGSSSRLRPALSTSSRSTMQRSGRESKREQSSDSVRSFSLSETQYTSNPKTPASANEREVLPVPGGPWNRYCDGDQSNISK